MATTFTDRDLGYKDVVKALGSLDEPAVLVGLRAEKDGSDLVKYAAANEFGVGRIPERSFLRSTVDENQETYLNDLEDVTGVYIDAGPVAGLRRLSRLGLRAVRDVQKKIVDLKTPENAPRTIAQKKSSNPLIDTGRMRQSIDFVVVNGDG